MHEEIWDEFYRLLARVRKLENELDAAKREIEQLKRRASTLEQKAESVDGRERSDR